MNFSLDKKHTYALIGVSKDSSKYGYKIFNNLISKGFNVFPINPNYDEILGKKCFNSISSISEKIDVVIFVVPPTVTKKILLDVVKLKINKVWFQPGSFDNDAIKICENNKLLFINDLCILLA